MPATFEVRGIKVRSASTRRFIVCTVTHEAGAITGARIFKRSDSFATAKAHVRRFGIRRGEFAVVIDSTTGEEV